MVEDFAWMAEARRRSSRMGEGVRYPCYSTIVDGHTPLRDLNGEMRVLYPADAPTGRFS